MSFFDSKSSSSGHSLMEQVGGLSEQHVDWLASSGMDAPLTLRLQS